MRKQSSFLSLIVLIGVVALAAGCGKASPAQTRRALAVETFLADIARNVAGERFQVDSLIPVGLDPHTFEPTPRDAAAIADSSVLIVNGAGFETWLQPVLQNAGGQRLVIEASAGLQMREPKAEELSGEEDEHHDEHDGDPHFWLDPLSVVRYVENIRDGLSQADAEGAQDYAKNAVAYIQQLQELNTWIEQQVAQISPEQRLLVTNHETFGYFADRYGFEVVGTIIPSADSSASPSAQQITGLVDKIRATGVKAIFLETGTNPQLAEQIARETGVKVITGLYTHSTTAAGGDAPTYLDMMRYNTRVIVEALK